MMAPQGENAGMAARAIVDDRRKCQDIEGLTFLPLALSDFFLYACYVDLLSLDHSS